MCLLTSGFFKSSLQNAVFSVQSDLYLSECLVYHLQNEQAKLDLKADSAQKACVYLASASRKCVRVYFQLFFFHVSCLTLGCVLCFVDELVFWGLSWLTDRLGNHSVQEGEINYLAAGFRGHKWPISNTLINRLKSLGEKACVSAIMCTVAFLWMCVWMFL